MTTKKRLNYIDWAKAISIALIVFGHILPSGCGPKTLAYAFHVPMFALIGGVLFSAPKNFAQFGKKLFGMFKRMVVPYMIWFAISASLYYLSKEKMPDIVRWSAKLVDGVTTLDFKQFIKFFFFYENATLWNDPLWFMPCYIFLSVLLLCFLFATRGNRIATGALSFTSFVTVIVLDELNVTINAGEVKNIFGLKNYFLMLGFLALGYAIRPLLDKCYGAFKGPKSNPILYGSIAIFIVSAIFCLKHNKYDYPGGYYPLSMYSAAYNGLWQYILFAILLSLSLLLVFMLLPESKIAGMFSRNSLFIMSTHYFFFAYDMTFYGVIKSKWKDIAGTAGLESWEISMKLGIRDAVFVLVVYLVLFLITDLLIKKIPKSKYGFELIGIK
ncbi:MAG: acyltransferase family protein [Clostridia bacterium]|nr:acyltransferase family protein [Clostridia bacterium]